MSEKGKNEYYLNANEIMNSINSYPNRHIEEGLADIHSRVHNVIKYNQIDEEKDKQKPIFYKINNVIQMHSSTSDDYFSFTRKQDLGDKVKIIGNIKTMNDILINLEPEDDEDDEES
jgi:hypothetical protein